MEKRGCVYILANERNGASYVGITSNLVKRIRQHKSENIEGFTKRYGVDRLVFYEVHDDIASAVPREKALKKLRRRWKLELIEAANPEWCDLYDEIASAVS